MVFQILSCMGCLYILEINSLSVSFAVIFSHSEGFLITLLVLFFVVQKLLSLIRSHLFIFAFISITLGGGLWKILLWFMSESVLPMFSSRSFIVSVLHLGLPVGGRIGYFSIFFSIGQLFLKGLQGRKEVRKRKEILPWIHFLFGVDVLQLW